MKRILPVVLIVILLSILQPLKIVSAEEGGVLPIPLTQSPAGDIAWSQQTEFLWYGQATSDFRIEIRTADSNETLIKEEVFCSSPPCSFTAALQPGTYKWHVAALTEEETAWSSYQDFVILEKNDWRISPELRYGAYLLAGALALLVLILRDRRKAAA